ncbi:hypothetical protein BDQ17DRAFT_1433557 [Cyathus striatus]|nr:hypothetical protein BDQ17DRAFT_1433557 [Cyathus striatus]
MSAPIRIPEDIADLIVEKIELLNDDEYSIRSCALICKSFTEPLRRRLFRKVELKDRDHYMRFYSMFITAPKIGYHVREFHLNVQTIIWELTLPYFINTALPYVRKLYLCFSEPTHETRKREYWHSLGYSLQNALGKILKVPSLESIAIKGLHNIRLAHIKSLLQIPNVVLDDSSFALQDRNDSLSRKDLGSCNLRSLTISALPFGKMLDFIYALSYSKSTLEELRVENYGDEFANFSIAQKIVAIQRDSLTKLVLKCFMNDSGRRTLDIGDLPNLRIFHVFLDFNWSDPLDGFIPTLRTFKEITKYKK